MSATVPLLTFVVSVRSAEPPPHATAPSATPTAAITAKTGRIGMTSPFGTARTLRTVTGPP
jgi:hypothetical protein